MKDGLNRREFWPLKCRVLLNHHIVQLRGIALHVIRRLLAAKHQRHPMLPNEFGILVNFPDDLQLHLLNKVGAC